MVQISNMPEETRRLEEALGKLGYARGSADGTADAGTRASALRLLGMLDTLFSETPQDLKNQPDGQAIARIAKSLDDSLDKKDEHGVTGLQKLQAIVSGDVDFLVKDIPEVSLDSLPRSVVKATLEGIYAKHGENNRAAAAAEVLEMAGRSNPETLKLYNNLQRYGLLKKLPEAVTVLEQRKQLFADLSGLEKAGLFKPEEKAAPKPETEPSGDDAPVPEDEAPEAEAPEPEELTPEQMFDNALAEVRKTIGVSGAGAFAEADQRALKAKIRTLQNDPLFGKDWTGKKAGTFSPEYLAHLQTRIAEMPQGTDAEKAQHQSMQRFADSLSLLSDNGVTLLTGSDRMNVAEASVMVEMALGKLGPVLDGALAKQEKKLDETVASLPDWLPDFIKNNIVSDETRALLSTRMPGVEEADGVFDINSQASLQAMLIVLCDPHVMNIPGHSDGVYTPELGQQIIAGLPKLKGVLAQNREEGDDPAQASQMESLLTPENVSRLVDSLDALHDRGLLAKQSLFSNQRVAKISPAVQKILKDQVALYQTGDLDTENRDAVKLMDVLAREIAGQENGLAALGITKAEVQEPADEGLGRAQKIQKFYEGARNRYRETNGGKDDGFDRYMRQMMDGLFVLPFGSAAEREALREKFTLALQGDSAAFGQSVAAAVDAARPGEARSAFAYSDYSVNSVRQDPRNGEISITSGGKTYGAEDVLKAYKNLNAGRHMLTHEGMTFKDDSGQTYVAAVDTDAMIFSVRKVDMESVRGILEPLKAEGSYENGMLAGEARKNFVAAVKADSALSVIVDVEGSRRTHGKGPDEYLEYLAQGSGIPQLAGYDFSGELPVARSDFSEAAKGGKGSKVEAPKAEVADTRGGDRRGVTVSSREGANISAEEVRTIAFLANEGRYMGKVFDSPSVMEQLQKAAGQNLHIGDMKDSQQRISYIDMSQAGGKEGTKVAFYDRAGQTLHVVDQSQLFEKNQSFESFRQEFASGAWIDRRNEQGGMYAMLRTLWLERHPERAGKEEAVDATQIREFRDWAISTLDLMERQNNDIVRESDAIPQKSWLAGKFDRSRDHASPEAPSVQEPEGSASGPAPHKG